MVALGFSVSSWLESHGLGAYSELFAAQQIDSDALVLLSDEHLRELGLPLGHRVRLLAAIRTLTTPPPAAADGGERRQLTIVFIDLVGSTALSHRLDPEDLRAVLRDYQHAVSAGIDAFDGHVARFVGDGVLAYFGYPTAHEHDAERAVRAARAIIDRVGQLASPTGERLAAHIGIATGLVVVGDLLTAGTSSEHAALGDAPNLAARLVDLAAPGQIVISAQTRALTRSLFDFVALDPQPIKGLPRPVTAYVVGAELAVESRFDAWADRRQGPLVGRREALAMLSGLWSKARSGQGQLVLLTGEAGIGKSRILRELRDSLASELHEQIVNQCSPFHADSALHPMIGQLRQSAGTDEVEAASDKLDRIEAMLAGATAQELALIARLLGLEGSAKFDDLALTPEQQRARTFDALLKQLERVSQKGPVLWILEDAHWVDPSTQELIALCAARIRVLPVLAVVTSRPESIPVVGADQHVSCLRLDRLSFDDAALLARSMPGSETLSDEVLREIASRSDGIPLFVEELTRAVIESPVDGLESTQGDRGSRLVPASLHDSMMARLDRQRPLREVAQVAACLGREFSRHHLAQLMGWSEETLSQALDGLRAADLIRRKGSGAGSSYTFKHALLRDAAYESLLKHRRTVIHSRILDMLGSDAHTPPEVLARHADEANLPEKAMEHWQRAGVQAIGKPAYVEAIAHLQRALKRVDGLDCPDIWRERRLHLLLLLGQATIPLRGYSHPETLAVFRQAEQLAAELPDLQLRFSVAYATWVVYYVRGEHDEALSVAQRMLDASLRADNDGQRLTALRTLAISQMIRGDPITAQQTFAQAQTLVGLVQRQTAARRIAVAQRFGADPDIATQFHVCLTLWAVGQVEDALTLSARTIDSARTMKHVHTLGHALAHGAIVAVVARDAAEALRLSAETIEFAEHHDMELWRGYGLVLNGYAQVLHGRPDAAIEVLRMGLGRLEQAETGAMVPVHRSVYAYALAATGQHDEADRIAALVVEELRCGTERYFWPDSWCWLGAYRRCRSPHDVAGVEEAFKRAVDSARLQRSPSWELMAATHLAAFWAETGRQRQAYDLLAPLVTAVGMRRAGRHVQSAVSLVKSLNSSVSPDAAARRE